MHHLCCLQCCLPSGIMGIVVDDSAPESLAEAEDASLCCLVRISSSRVRRLTCLMGMVSVGTCVSSL